MVSFQCSSAIFGCLGGLGPKGPNHWEVVGVVEVVVAAAAVVVVSCGCGISGGVGAGGSS